MLWNGLAKRTGLKPVKPSKETATPAKQHVIIRVSNSRLEFLTHWTLRQPRGYVTFLGPVNVICLDAESPCQPNSDLLAAQNLKLLNSCDDEMAQTFGSIPG